MYAILIAVIVLNNKIKNLKKGGNTSVKDIKNPPRDVPRPALGLLYNKVLTENEIMRNYNTLFSSSPKIKDLY